MERVWIGLLIGLLGLLAITQAGPLARNVQVARAGKLLRAGLVMRDKAGDLPLGAGTPGMYALGRASGAQGQAPKGAAGSLVNLSGNQLIRVAGAERLAGIALGTAGRTNAAEQTLAMASPDTDPFAALALGNVLDEQGKRGAALAVWQPFDEDRALGFQLYRKGTAMTSRNQRAEAERVLVLATEIDPANASALHALAGYYWSTDQAKSAELYRRALQAASHCCAVPYPATRLVMIEDTLHLDRLWVSPSLAPLVAEHPRLHVAGERPLAFGPDGALVSPWSMRD